MVPTIGYFCLESRDETWLMFLEVKGLTFGSVISAGIGTKLAKVFVSIREMSFQVILPHHTVSGHWQRY